MIAVMIMLSSTARITRTTMIPTLILVMSPEPIAWTVVMEGDDSLDE